MVYSTNKVFSNFRNKTGIDVQPHEVDGWEFLKRVSIKNNLKQDIIDTAEDDWYRSDVLENSSRYIYARPIVRMTVNKYGIDRNLVLTSREHHLRSATENWMTEHIPIPTSNLLIRERSSLLKGKEFKVKEVKEKSQLADWVVFIDDSTDFIRGVLESGVKNCLAINVPQGLVKPDFNHEHLIVIGRYPEESQAMYPLYTYIKTALEF